MRKAVEQKLALLLTRPESVDLRAVQLEAAQPEAGDSEGGISASLAERIEAAMRGDV